MTSPLARAAHQWRELRSRLLASMPELADDEECLVDTLDGETDIKEQLAGVIRSAITDEHNAESLDNYIKKLSDRKAAIKRRADKKRAVASHFMQDCGITKLTPPDFTATIRNVPAPVSIYDETQLPESYVRVKREPDKSAIRNALKDGENVPGAQLGNASQTLMVKI